MQKIEPTSYNNRRILMKEYHCLCFFLGENTVTMTYEVEWVPSETRWASR